MCKDRRTLSVLAFRQGLKFVQIFGLASFCLCAGAAKAQPLQQPASQAQDVRLTAAPDEMFIEMRVPVHQIYLGESLRVQYDVYVASRRGQVFYEVEEPDFHKWYALEDKTPPAYQASVNGQSYTLEPFAVYFVTPATLGKLPLPTLKVQIPYLDTKPWISHKPRFIEVIPPPSPAPEHFALGNVGIFELKSALSASTVRKGDVITLEIEIIGTAPVSGIQLAPYTLTTSANAFKVYAFTPETLEEKIEHDQFKSVIKGHIQLLALQDGQWTLDPIRLVAFNPRTHQYQTYATQPLTIDVEPANKNLNLTPPRAKLLQLEAWDITPIHLSKAPSNTSFPMALLAVPPVLLICTLIGMASRRKKALQAKDEQKKEQNEQLFTQFEKAKTASEQLKLLSDIVKLRYHWEISPSQTETEQWIRKHWPPEDADMLIQIIQKLQMAKYSTQEVLPSAMVDKANRILQKKQKRDR